jgi:hypothetical protein
MVRTGTPVSRIRSAISHPFVGARVFGRLFVILCRSYQVCFRAI